jgi:uncharacterized HAD superfamily protein
MSRVPKPLLGCDIDGVIYPFTVAARTLLRMRGNDVVVSEDADKYWNHLPDVVPAEEWRWLWNSGRKQVFDMAQPYPGSITALKQIEQLCRIKYVTHRPADCARITMDWMARQHLNPYSLMHTPGEPKSPHAVDCIAFIEDRVDNAVEIAENTDAQVFVPRRSWNDGRVPQHIIMFDDWEVVVSWVRRQICLMKTS